MRTTPPQLLLLGSIASVQFGSAFADRLFDRAGPAGVVLLRLLLAAIVLNLITRPSLLGRSRRDLMFVVAFGLVLGTMNWSFYEAIDRLPLGVAVTVEFTGPLVVAVLGSRRALDAVWIVLAGGGVALLAVRGSHAGVTVLGVLLALAAACCWALYIFLSKRVGAAFAKLDGLALAMLIGTLVAAPAGIVEGGGELLKPAILAGGLGVAIFSSLLPYSLEITALRRLTPAAFGLLQSLQPAVATLAGVIVLSQSVSLTLAIALLMVVTASVGSTLAARRQAPVIPAPGQIDPIGAGGQ